MELSTERLRLIALDYLALKEFGADPDLLGDDRGLAPFQGLQVAIFGAMIEQAVRVKLIKMESAPLIDHPWYTFWLIVVREAQFGVGVIGFKRAPDVYGAVEMGYEIDPAWQRRGYMTEAVGAMVNWAFLDRRCQRVTAETRPENQPSIRVIEKNGLQLLGTRAGMLFWALERDDWERLPRRTG